MGLLQLRYEHDSSTIRLRFDYAATYTYTQNRQRTGAATIVGDIETNSMHSRMNR